MIPKIIHYIWFGGKPFPNKVLKCIESWHKYLPDYEFKLWNEDTFDVNSVEFTRQAYANKKWAFVSDYVRMYALNKFGGWYLDTDIEILRPIERFEVHRMVLGTDHDGALTALMGSEPNHPYWSEVLAFYDSMNFVNKDGTFNMTVNNTHLQGVLESYGYKFENKYQELKEGIVVYPDDYFHVANNEKGTIHKTNNSYAIHWHTLLWTSEMSHLNRWFRLHIMKPIFGEERFMEVYTRFTSLFKR